jgi:uncharacterized BrkB/YihY/UPF0761 family membrane protein
MPLAVLASATAGAISTLSANGLIFVMMLLFYVACCLLIVACHFNYLRLYYYKFRAK